MLILLASLWCYRRLSRRQVLPAQKKFQGDRQQPQGLFASLGWRSAVVFMAVASMMTQTVQAADGFVPRRLGNGDLGASLARNESLMAAIKGGQKHFREGTSLPSTAGEIVLVGRRWVFVPNMEDRADEDPSNDSANELPRGRRILSAAKIRRTSELGDDDGAEDGSDESSRKSNHWVLVENLMLQRIVRAIRIDSIDDKWIVTGRITEYFDDNYLMLESAKRSNR